MNKFPMLPENQNKFLNDLKEELLDNSHKVQLYRTETEMRVAVLNDASFPTPASKYWQSVREMDVMHRELIKMSFEYRKTLIKLKRLQKEFEETDDELKKEELQVDIDKQIWLKGEAELVGKDRVRELEHWSRIKKELDDGSFDTKNVDTHQPHSLREQLLQRKKYIKEETAVGEQLNVLGPLKTADRIYEKKYLEESKNGVTKNIKN